MALGAGLTAGPTDEVGILRSNDEGYATLASVASVLAPLLVSSAAGNQLQVVTSGGVNYLFVSGTGTVADSIDDNPQRTGNTWAAGDQMAIAPVGAVDEKADVDAYLADAVANATTFNTALTTLIQNYVNTNISNIDSIDDNPARAGNAWAAGDQLAVAQVGAADEKVDADAYLADAVANATNFNTALTTLIQNYVNTNIGSIDSVDDNPARTANAWAAGDQLAIAPVGAVDEKADFAAYLASAISNSATVKNALLTTVVNLITNDPPSMQAFAAAIISADAFNSLRLGTDNLLFENDGVL